MTFSLYCSLNIQSKTVRIFKNGKIFPETVYPQPVQLRRDAIDTVNIEILPYGTAFRIDCRRPSAVSRQWIGSGTVAEKQIRLISVKQVVQMDVEKQQTDYIKKKQAKEQHTILEEQ